MWFGFRKIDGVEAAILPEILNRVLRAELRVRCDAWYRRCDTASHHAPPPPCNRAGPPPLRPLGARATALFKRNSTSCLIGTRADILSWLRLRTVFRHPCLQTRGGDSVAAKSPSLGHLACARTNHEYLRCGTWSRAARSFPSLVLRLRWLGLARYRSLGLITLGCAIALS